MNKFKHSKTGVVSHNGYHGNSNNAAMYEANRNLTFVPVVFIAVRIWGTIRFIVGAHFPAYSNSGALIAIVILQVRYYDSPNGEDETVT